MPPLVTYCVPSWNSLPYLQILIKGIKRHAQVPYDIIVHDNGSEDGTLAWLQEHGIRCTHSSKNLGFCGVNHALKEASSPYVMLFNSDMYPLPGWDLRIFQRIGQFAARQTSRFTISSCLVEPIGNNPEYSIRNFGADHSSFQEQQMLLSYNTDRAFWFEKGNTIQYSHPILLPRNLLEEIGYMDERYFPGWASDHDLAAAAYHAGCRDFVMLGWSRVYHFVSKTFTQLPEEVRRRDGQDIFRAKRNMTVDEFRNLIRIRQPVL
jgi:GT2 family glycosyltransferase